MTCECGEELRRGDKGRGVDRRGVERGHMLAGPMLLLEDRGKEGGALLRSAGPRSGGALLDSAVRGRGALVATMERPGVHVSAGGFPVTDEGGAAFLRVLSNGLCGSRIVCAEERRAVLSHYVELR